MSRCMVSSVLDHQKSEIAQVTDSKAGGITGLRVCCYCLKSQVGQFLHVAIIIIGPFMEILSVLSLIEQASHYTMSTVEARLLFSCGRIKLLD